MKTISAQEIVTNMLSSDCEPELSIVYEATFKDEAIIFDDDYIETDFYCDYEPDIPAILDNYEVFC